MLDNLIQRILSACTFGLSIRHWPHWAKSLFLLTLPVSVPAWIVMATLAMAMLLLVYLLNWALDRIRGEDHCNCFYEDREGRCIEFIAP